MAISIFSNYKIFARPGGCKNFSRPDDVLNDTYLTQYQKNMILESMLAEIRDARETQEFVKRDLFSKTAAQKETDVIKAQSKLKSMMNQEPYN